MPSPGDLLTEPRFLPTPDSSGHPGATWTQGGGGNTWLTPVFAEVGDGMNDDTSGLPGNANSGADVAMQRWLRIA